MPHSSHDMDAYRDVAFVIHGSVWVAYCKKCSAETNADLEKECPGEYVRRTIPVDKLLERD